MGAPWALFRADASAQIGSGHIMRCLSLANQMREQGWHCVFAARQITPSFIGTLKANGHDVLRLTQDNAPPPSKADGYYADWLGTTQRYDARQMLEAALPLCEKYGSPNLVICDHYGLDQIWETLVITALDSQMVVIDDLSNRAHDCDLLIDTTYGKTEDDYEGLVPPKCRLLIGSEYALLRPEFPKDRPLALKRRDMDYQSGQPVKMLLISMGGMDKDNVSAKILTAVSALGDNQGFTTEVLVGSEAPHLPVLNDMASHTAMPVKIHAGTPRVAELLSRADLCVGAAGSSTWERCALGLPTINVVIADNQQTIADNLAHDGVVVDGGNAAAINARQFADDLIKPLIQSAAARQALSQKARRVCDGRGVERVSLALHQRIVKQGKRVQLRLASEEDIERVYAWQKLPETRKYANNPNPPTWDEHNKWMQNRLLSGQDYFYIIECDSVPCGVLRLDFDPNAKRGERAYTVSIFIAPEFFGLGVASAALSLLSELHPNKNIWAQVHSSNLASVKLFTQAGYIWKYDDWYQLSRDT